MRESRITRYGETACRWLFEAMDSYWRLASIRHEFFNPTHAHKLAVWYEQVSRNVLYGS